MKNENKINLLTYSSLFVSVLIGVFAVLAPYLLQRFQYLAGFDAGLYVFEAMHYARSSFILDSVTLWNEPGLYVLSLPLQHYFGSPALSFKILFALYIVLSAVVIVLFTKKYVPAYFSVLGAVLIALSTIQINAIYLFLLKQMIASVVFLTFVYFYHNYFHLEKKPAIGVYVLLVILSSFILYSHRAVSLFWMVFLGFYGLAYLMSRDWKKFKSALFIGCISVLLVLPYYFPIIREQFAILADFIQNSYSNFSSDGNIRDHAGQPLTGSLHSPLRSYFTSIAYLAIFFLAGLYFMMRSENYKKFPSHIVFLLLFFLLFVALKFVFSNRVLLNLDFFVIILIVCGLSVLASRLRKSVLISVFTVIIVLALISGTSLVLSKRPYAGNNLEGMEFINSNISKEHTMFFASDAWETILAQQGYFVSQYHLPASYDANGTYVDKLSWVRSDDFLVMGYSDQSLLNSYEFDKYDVYVLVDSYSSSRPLPRGTLNSSINIAAWDESSAFETVYSGQGPIRRIYRWKHE